MAAGDAAPGPGDAPTPAPDSEFLRATAVRPLGDSVYTCELDPGWRTAVGISGGILMAIIVRAIKAEHPERMLRSLQCQFLRPPTPGEATVTLETVRTGRRATNLRARVEQHGKLMIEALATIFAGELREVATWAPAMPDVPPPGTAPLRDLDPRMPPIADHLIYRPAIGPPPFSGTKLEHGEPARTGGWLELRDPSPIDPALVAFFVDAWWPAALGPLTTISTNPTIDLALHLRTALPDEGLPHQPLLLDVLTAASLEGLVDEDARLFTADGTLIAQSRQLAITLTPEDRPMTPPRA